MPATNIAVIYADSSKVIRRVIVSDTDGELQRASVTVPGEKVLLLPFQEYQKSDDRAFRSAVAAQIGEPGPDRCVEITPKGLVVAAYHADSLIDKPQLPGNALELHDSADVGDVKMKGTGKFFSTKPVVILTKQQLIDNARVFDPGLPLADASAIADAQLAEQTAKDDARVSALEQLAAP